MPDKKQRGAPNIILDLSIKNALEKRAQVTPSHDVVFPWWFKRSTVNEYSTDQWEAYGWLMSWLQENAPMEAENVFDESDLTQNIIINPMFLVSENIFQAFKDAGFKVMEEKDLPSQERTDIYDRLKHGSNFNTTWH